MQIKIYFDEKPLFLCDQISEDLQAYIHHEDTVLIDECSSHAINAMIHEMRSQKIHAGILLHPRFEELKTSFWKKFSVVQAAGGVVYNQKKEVLFIFRRGKWDLPKGKLDEGESIPQCAVREVEEETGLQGVQIDTFLLVTYHTYTEKGKSILKESHWFVMRADGTRPLVPQTMEDISEARWLNRETLSNVMENTFPSIHDVLNAVEINVKR